MAKTNFPAPQTPPSLPSVGTPEVPGQGAIATEEAEALAKAEAELEAQRIVAKAKEEAERIVAEAKRAVQSTPAPSTSGITMPGKTTRVTSTLVTPGQTPVRFFR